MLRHAFAMEGKEGRTAEFRSNLGKVWAELTAFLDEKKMVNFSMWNVERMVFGYYETEDDFTFTDADKEKAFALYKAKSELGWYNNYAAKWIIRAGKDARELQPKAYKLALNRCIKAAFDGFVSREKTKENGTTK